MIKKILKILTIFIIGMVGGIFATQVFWPYFVERPLFYKYKLDRSPVYVTERIVVQENIALTQAVEKVEKVVVGIKTETQKGSGLIITSDGLMVTLADFVPPGSKPSFFLNGEQVSFQVEKRDPDKNLVLIRIDEGNLPTAGFADLGKLKRGQRVFLVGAIFSENSVGKMVNEGIVKFFEKDFIRTNIFEKNILRGSALFDIEGNVLGINIIDIEGKVTAIPISEIREFAGF